MLRRRLIAAVGHKATGELPSSYTLVNYLEGTGTQYIDTGVSGGTNAEYEIELDPLSKYVSSYEQYLAGDKTASAPKIYRSYNRIEASSSKIYRISITGRVQKIAFRDGNLYCDDAQDGPCIAIGFKGWGTLSFYVFNSHSEPNLISSMRLYSLKMCTDGVMVRDFIPCYRNEDSKPGLYDTVTGEFFTNVGTGEFIWG